MLHRRSISWLCLAVFSLCDPHAIFYTTIHIPAMLDKGEYPMKIDSLRVVFISTNCYLLCDEETGVCALIDPGD